MNIHNNRYVIFIAPTFWCLTAMLATKSYYNAMLSIIFIFHNLVNLIVISHKNFLNFTPHQIYYYYTYIVKQNIVQTVICIFGFTNYAFLGSLIVFIDPYKISLFAGTCWVICYIVSFVYNILYMEWWGILLILWGFIRHLCYDHINKISIEKRHNLIWTLKLLETIILYTMRWFVYCSMVFPHEIRYDLTLFALTITSICTTVVSYKIKSKELKYIKQPDKNHFPAPDKETAEQCVMCKDIIQIVDVENQEGKIL